MKPKSSLLWSYFTEAEKERVTCNLCQKLYSRKGRSTTPLKSHLRAKHPLAYEEFLKSTGGKVESKGSVAKEINSNRIWRYFKNISENTVHCVICTSVLDRKMEDLQEHIVKRHPALLSKSNDIKTDDEDETITEIVFIKDQPNTSKTPAHQETHSNEDLDNFGKYVTSLLKKLPTPLATTLQMKIINLIMNTKLNFEMKEPINRDFIIENTEESPSMEENDDF